MVSQFQPVSPRRRCLATLIGFFPELEAIKLLLDHNFDDLPTSLTQLHELWEQHFVKCQELEQRKNLSTLFLSRPILEDYTKRIKNRASYIRFYQNTLFEIRLVPLQQLITAQWYLDIGYCQELTHRAPKPTSDDLGPVLSFLYDKKPFPRPHYGPNNDNRSLLFPETIGGIDARFVGTIPQQENEVYEVRLRLSSNFNHLHVVQINRFHFVIINGVHHACALLQAGWEKIPCLVRKQVTSTDMGLPPEQPGVIPPDRILHHQRPPYLSDYFEETIAPRFHQVVIDQCTLQTQFGMYSRPPVLTK